jgi:futalosine hydrolase
MKTKILITAATIKELQSVDVLRMRASFDIDMFVTGVGSMSTIYNLMSYFEKKGRPDFLINIGIAGSFSPEFAIGDTMIVESDCFADIGIEDQSGFKSIWETGLIQSSEFPFENGYIKCDPEIVLMLGDSIRRVKGITVNMASGREETIERYLERHNPDIETMEVAAVLYVGRMEDIPVIALRSISNKIEPRNRDAWDILSALSALQPAFDNILNKIDTI